MKLQKARLVPAIVFLNTIVFLLWYLEGLLPVDFMENHFLVSWDGLLDGRYWQLLTSVFSHNMFLHFFLNMYVLINFGSLIEMVLGKRFFLKFYLVAGIVSSLSHVLVSAYLIGDSSLKALGASGAISGLILLFCFMFPKEKILLLGFIPIPA
ncbi:MAG TPA: rhomboid family intramembrane serine protease, partial [Pseudobdellovibrionaceae bacterium]|nr:rhomboid family intramembrane serine protease [Pseudobdellovibrionaceae bacterium]